MPIKSIDQRIRQAFSQAAVQYDMLTSLHKEIGRELVSQIKDTAPCLKILDVGMGTGYVTKKLKNYFSEAMVVGIDFAPGMTKAADDQEKDFHIIQADARALPFKDETFDLVVSNLAYQWVENLEDAFRACHTVLKEGGVFSAAIFGLNTFRELFEALAAVLNEKKQYGDIKRLAGYEEIKQVIQQAGFNEIDMDFERIKVRFPDMMAMVQWMKDIGANQLERNFYVGKDLLAQASDYYEKKFRDRFGIYATFEVIWVYAKK